MIVLLQGIFNAVRSSPFFAADALVAAFNAFIAAVAVLAAGLIALLPSFPQPPSSPPGEVVGVIAWIAPLGAMLVFFAAMLSAWIAFLAVKVVLNWVKAL